MSDGAFWIKGEDTECIKTELGALSLETEIIDARGWIWHLREKDKDGEMRRYTRTGL